MDRGAWRATVYGVTNSRTRLSDWATEHTPTLSTYTDKCTGKKRQPLVLKDGPGTGHTKHKYSDSSSNIYLSVSSRHLFFRFKFIGAAHRNNYPVVQAPENFPWHNQLIHLNMMVDSLEEEMANHSSTGAWRIPWSEEPRGLQSVGLQTAGCDWATEHKQHAWWLE